MFCSGEWLVGLIGYVLVVFNDLVVVGLWFGQWRGFWVGWFCGLCVCFVGNWLLAVWI